MLKESELILEKDMNEKNYCVIMAGGIGSRFWPFSRNNRPKQFLDFFGTGRSLLQMTVDRFRPIIPIENILIVTNVAYKEMILEQIPDMEPDQVLCEPARRNTAPCIAYAIAHIKGMMRRRGDETMNANIVVAPSDHLILQEDRFREVIEQGFRFIEANDSLLTLGMQPTRPETGYGYIQKDRPILPNDGMSASLNDELKGAEIYKVKTFTEKPNRELAEVFVKSGEFLWNAGIFLWNLRAIDQAFKTYLPEVADIFEKGDQQMGTAEEDAFIQTNFPSCPNISIDYGIMEKAPNVFVLPASFGWSDLGTWGSLYELSDKDAQGNVTLKSEAMYYESENNVVTLQSGNLAVVKGLNNYIIAEADGVLLICPKREEQSIRKMVADAEEKFQGRYD